MIHNALIVALILLCASIALAAAPEVVPPQWKAGESTTHETKEATRGFGPVTATYVRVTSPDGSANVFAARFDASSPEKAAAVLGKFLSDLKLSPDAKDVEITVAGKTFPGVVLAGGATYTGVTVGDAAFVIAAIDAKVLHQFAGASAAFTAAEAQATNLKYPNYLDRFDKYGWGFYGYAGVHGELNWKASAGADPDPVEDLKWAAKHDFRADFWLDATQFDRSWGLLYWPELQWKFELAKKLNFPVSTRVYGQVPWVPWMMDMYEEPAWWNQNGYHGNQPGQGLYWKAIPHQSWFDHDSQLYMARQTQEQMKRVMDQDVLSWMHPHGEVVHNEWYNLHADYSPKATANWRAELRDKHKLSLDEVSKMYNRVTPFKSWDEVTVPEFATFAGLPGEVQDLSGTWYIRPEKEKDEGVKGEWWKADVKTADWDHFTMPGSDFWYKEQGQKWCVRDFTFDEKNRPAGPLYLYLYINPTGAPKERTTVYLNGESIGEVGLWGAIDVSKLLKSGENRLAFRNEFFDGRIFLSTEPPAVYPYLTEARNTMWVIWKDWLRNSKKEGWATQLKAMRLVDDQRPIKLMACSAFGADGWIDLVQKYGGIAHFTGEGVWFFPWYKRTGKLYDLPATSEGAGPANNVEQQVNLFQRIFLEGLDGHDQVFLIQHTSRVPELRQWYEDHVATLKQLGRYDISGPQVMIYRAFDAMENVMQAPFPEHGDATRQQHSAFDWDLGRGTLQTIGQSYLYIDDGGLADGKLNGYSVLIDSGNEAVRPESLQKIEEWVKNGGTYVVWPFTGRNTWTKGDAWPISQLTGCTVEKIRKPGEGKVTIATDQTLLKEHAGKTFDDAGVSMDFRNVNHNDISTELKPGADCQVIATFENGAPAIVVRNLGKGKVITLGSAFARDSKDQMGIWWPGEREANFFRDLLNGLGQPSPQTTTDPRVWAQRYRMNNGIDDVIVLNNFADGDRTITLTATMPAKPTKVYEIARNSTREVAFDVADGVVTIKDLPVKKDEVQIYIFRTNDAGESIEHWWTRNVNRWRPVETPAVDFSSISSGRWIDPVVDLQEDWKWTQGTPAKDWAAVEASDSDWKNGRLDVMNFYGADPKQTVYLRKRFTVPADWKTNGGPISLAQGAWSGNFFVPGVQGQLYLNGELLHDWNDGPYMKFDITNKLRDGDNVVAVAMRPGPSKYLGAIGSTWVYQEPKAVETISLAGDWTVQQDGKAATLKLPGKGTGTWPTKTIKIPAEWKDKYIVTYHAIGDRNNSAGVYVNERLVRRHHHLLGDEVEVSLNAFLKFGEENTLNLYQPEGPNWNLSTIELRLYPKTQ